MIYILAILVPPVALLLEGKVLGAVLTMVLCFVALVVFFPLYLAVGAGACLVISQKRSGKRHRELVDALSKGGR